MTTLIKRTALVGNTQIVLIAGNDQHGQPVVVAQRHCEGPNVASLSLVFEMKTLDAAAHFVQIADDAVFARAAGHLAEQQKQVDLLEDGLSGKLKYQLTWSDMQQR